MTIERMHGTAERKISYLYDITFVSYDVILSGNRFKLN